MTLPSDLEIKTAATAAGIRLTQIAAGLFLIQNQGNFPATIGTNGGKIRVRIKTGHRWRTVGNWATLVRALRGIKDEILP